MPTPLHHHLYLDRGPARTGRLLFKVITPVRHARTNTEYGRCMAGWESANTFLYCSELMVVFSSNQHRWALSDLVRDLQYLYCAI